MIRTIRWLVGLVLALSATALAGAQFDLTGGKGGKGSLGPVSEEAAPLDRAEVIVEAYALTEHVAPGGELVVAIVLDHAPGWHTWPSADQDVLPPEVAGFALRTRASIADDRPAWLHAVGPVQWPEPAEVVNPLGDPPTVRSYKGRAVAFLPALLREDAELGTRTLPIEVFYQACDDLQCLAPETVQVDVSFRVVEPSEDASALVERAAGDGAGFDAAVFDALRDGTLASEPVDAGSDLARGADAAPPIDRRLFGISFGSTAVGLAVASLIGGALLNLMPCVLPVIPIKIMTLANHAQGSRARTMQLGLAMAIGVAAFWIAVGIPVAVTAGSIDPSAIFSYWPVTLGLGVLLAAMGIGIMGVFTLNLPRSVYLINPKADSVGGSFMFGVMTAVLGLPCFGPIVGGLLAGGATLQWYEAMTVFAGLGVGMAAPYLVLSASPGLVKKLPQSGPAGELVKQAMGMLMIAAGVFFATTGFKTLFKIMPYLSADSEYLFATIVLVAAGLWIVFKARRAAKALVGKAVVGVVGAVIVGVSVWAASGAISEARANFLEREAALADAGDEGEGGVVPGVWMEFTEARLARARDEGYTVLVDFTADWCITCRAFKAQALDPEPARSRLREGDVVLLEADFDRPAVKEFLKNELGRTGIPVWALYEPGAETAQPIDLPTTPGAVVRRLDAAANAAEHREENAVLGTVRTGAPSDAQRLADPV